MSNNNRWGITLKRDYYAVREEYTQATVKNEPNELKYKQGRQEAICSMISALEDFSEKHKVGEWIAEETDKWRRECDRCLFTGHTRLGRYYERQGRPTPIYVLHENIQWGSSNRLFTNYNYVDTIFALKLTDSKSDQLYLQRLKEKMKAGKASLCFDRSEIDCESFPLEFTALEEYKDNKRKYGICDLTFSDSPLAENQLGDFPQLRDMIKKNLMKRLVD